MPLLKREVGGWGQDVGLYVKNINGTDWVGWGDFGGSASVQYVRDGVVRFQLNDGRVACRSGDWLEWRDPNDGWAYEVHLEDTDRYSNIRMYKYTKLGGYWLYVDGESDCVTTKSFYRKWDLLVEP